jgi:hypothetical protein
MIQLFYKVFILSFTLNNFIKNVQHSALLEYLNERKVANQTAFLKEIHYRMNGKNYFGIG